MVNFYNKNIRWGKTVGAKRDTVEDTVETNTLKKELETKENSKKLKKEE